jgi:hypothetical protein
MAVEKGKPAFGTTNRAESRFFQIYQELALPNCRRRVKDRVVVVSGLVPGRVFAGLCRYRAPSVREQAGPRPLAGVLLLANCAFGCRIFELCAQQAGAAANASASGS